MKLVWVCLVLGLSCGNQCLETTASILGNQISSYKEAAETWYKDCKGTLSALPKATNQEFKAQLLGARAVINALELLTSKSSCYLSSECTGTKCVAWDEAGICTDKVCDDFEIVADAPFRCSKYSAFYYLASSARDAYGFYSLTGQEFEKNQELFVLGLKVLGDFMNSLIYADLWPSAFEAYPDIMELIRKYQEEEGDDGWWFYKSKLQSGISFSFTRSWCVLDVPKFAIDVLLLNEDYPTMNDSEVVSSIMNLMKNFVERIYLSRCLFI